jgi:hypothetical protein
VKADRRTNSPALNSVRSAWTFYTLLEARPRGSSSSGFFLRGNVRGIHVGSMTSAGIVRNLPSNSQKAVSE